MSNRPEGAEIVAARTSLRSIAERGAHLLWTLHFIVTLGLLSTALGILLFDAMVHLIPHLPINPMSDTAVLLLLLAGANVPLSVAGRHWGVLHLHFLDHESYVLTSNQDEEESFVSSGGLHLLRLLDRLEQAPLLDRQAVRRQLRLWLDAHHHELTERELDDVEERCPYLFDPAWRNVARGT
jgi:hypothetical protein